MNRYDVLEFISQGKDGALSKENEVLARIADDVRRATGSRRTDEAESGTSLNNVIFVNEAEQRFAESYAKENNCWIPFLELNKCGVPGPCGSEANTYVSKDGYVYKMNNMLHCEGSIVRTLEKFILHNLVFHDTRYTFVGFTGFDGRSIYPVVKQTFIKECESAQRTEILDFMTAMGFGHIADGVFQNDQYLIKDVLPKNVLKDNFGEIYVIDVEISLL